MSNPYLKKVLETPSVRKALTVGKRNARVAGRTIKSFPAHNKLGLGLGVTSLGLGLVNMHNNAENARVNRSKADLEAKSLAALNKIHKALSDKKE